MQNTKTILLIGGAGCGKSTLANVITNINKFTESGSGIEETEIGTDNEEKVKYQVIDTVAISDTEMPTWEVLYKLAKMNNSVKDGLSQILLVTKESFFADDVKETYKFLEKFFFDQDITKYTTIVRTHFLGFRNEEKRNRDRLVMKKENNGFNQVIEGCSGIIYVDNPPIDDEDSWVQSENRRKYSKDILEIHLKVVLKDENKYKPENLDKFNELVNSYIEKENKEKINKKEFQNLKREIVEKTLQHILEIDKNFSQKEEIEKHLIETKKGFKKIKLEEEKNTKFKKRDESWRLVSEEEESFSWFIKQNFTLESFWDEINKYRKLFNNEPKDLLYRWKQDFNKKNPNAYQIFSLQSQLTNKEQEISTLNERLNNHSLSQIDIEKILNEKKELEKSFKQIQAQLNEFLTKEKTHLLEQKEQELEELRKKGNKSQKYIVAMLLDSVEHLTSYDISSTRDLHKEQKENHINHLLNQGMKKEEIDKLCEAKTEMVKLKLEIEGLLSIPKKQLLSTFNQKEQLLLEFTDHPIFTQKLLEQVNKYLTSKRSFIDTRKETITLLQELVNVIENKTVTGNGKYVRLEKGSNVLNAVLKIAPLPSPIIGDLISKSISISINYFKGKFNKESVELFKEHLGNSDNVDNIIKQKEFLLEIINKHPNLNSSQSVIELFKLSDEQRIFNEEYEIYKVATNIWANKPTLTIDDMKSAISELSKNILVLERELKQEKQEISKLSGEMTNLEQQVMSCSIQQA